MDDKRSVHGFPVSSDGLLHWDDVRRQIYSEDERSETDHLVHLIGSMIMSRKVKGLTQGELADRIGLKQSAIARFESGDTIPRLDTFLKVADALELEIQLKSNSRTRKPQRQSVETKGALSPLCSVPRRASVQEGDIKKLCGRSRKMGSPFPVMFDRERRFRFSRRLAKSRITHHNLHLLKFVFFSRLR